MLGSINVDNIILFPSFLLKKLRVGNIAQYFDLLPTLIWPLSCTQIAVTLLDMAT